jgi:GNAT superfamily N-acetyltransferase
MIRVQRIRKMTPELAAEIEHMDAECFSPHDKPEPTSKGYWWLAREGARVVGYAAAAVVGDTMYLTRAGVVPAARGRNIQARLIRARVQYARRLRLARVHTYTVYWNMRSANNLLACGFRLWRPAKPWGGKWSLYYYRRLA